MKFKKDDIVEVIKKDKWQGIAYPVGTQLRVCEDQEDECVVRIYDSMQKQGGYAKLWEWNLKLVKREEDENEMKFKAGDKLTCVKTDTMWWTVGKEYEVRVINGKPSLVDDERDSWSLSILEMYTNPKFKLKKEKEEPTTYTKSEIHQQISIAYQHFNTDAERLAYLQGYFAK